MGRHRTHTFLAAALVALASVGAGAAAPAPAAGGGHSGTVDRSFGSDGRAYSVLPPAYDFGTFTHLAEAPGGGLVDSVEEVSAAFTNSLGEVAIQRRLPDGSLDPSFGDGGSVSLAARPGALGVDASGRVLYTGGGTVQRLDPDGSVDAGFQAPASIHTGFEAGGIALTPDGDTVVAGRYQLAAPKDVLPEEGIVVARLNPDGSFDGSFGKGGVLAFPRLEPNVSATFEGVAALPDGSLLLLAEGGVFHYRPDGSADTAFGKEGSVTLPEHLASTSLLAYPDGGFAVAGAVPPAGGGRGTDYEVLRYGADGAPVTSFGKGGAATIDVREQDEPIELAAGPEGGSVLSGRSYVRKADGPMLEPTPVAIRLDASGRPVADFGEAGVLTIQPSAPPAGIETPELRVTSSVVGPSGRIALAGTDGDALLIARGADGEPEPGFGGGASQVTQVATGGDATTATGLVAVPSGGLFVSALTNSARRTPAPALVGFGAGGKQVALGPLGFAPLEVAGPIVADGPRLLVSLGHRPGRYYLARTDLFGAPDRGFGEGGKQLLPDGVGAHGAVVERGGAIVAFGHSQGHGMAVVRYTATGRRDRSFGKGGVAYVGFPQSFATAYAAVVLPDGGLVLAGADGRFVALARLLPDGRLDRSFGRGGRTLLGLGRDAKASVLARFGNGLIVAGKQRHRGEPTRAFALRVGTDGRPQRGFGHLGFLDASGMKRPIAILPSRHEIVLVGSLPKGGVALRAFGTKRGRVARRFGADGTVRTVVRQGRFRFNPVAAARVRGGGIVVAGSSGNPTRRGSRVELIRFHG